MIGIVIVTHGDLSKALASSAALIINQPCSIETYGLYHGDDVDELKETVKEAIQRQYKASDEKGVLILTDLFGGSPSNVTAKALHELRNSVKVECLTGVNLPIVLEAIVCAENQSLEELTKYLEKIGKNGILNLKEKYSL